jgi:hypothetical protein
MRPPLRLPQDEGDWRTFHLTKDEAGLKQRVLADAYRSQTLIIGRFLQAFARPNELFLEGERSTAPECWCDDTHVATELPPARYRRAGKTRR